MVLIGFSKWRKQLMRKTSVSLLPRGQWVCDKSRAFCVRKEKRNGFIWNNVTSVRWILRMAASCLIHCVELHDLLQLVELQRKITINAHEFFHELFFLCPDFSNIRIIFRWSSTSYASRDIEYCQFSTKGAYLYWRDKLFSARLNLWETISSIRTWNLYMQAMWC